MYKFARTNNAKKKLLSHEMLGDIALWLSFIHLFCFFLGSVECSNKSVVAFFSHPSPALRFPFRIFTSVDLFFALFYF